MADELNGGAPAPAEDTAAPEIQVTETPKAEPTPRGAIDRAFEALEVQDKATDKPDAATEEKPKEAVTDRPRNPDGTFAKAEDGAPEQVKTETKPEEKTAGITEAPSRFSPDAKAAWADVPDAVKGEVHRALREAEQGIDKYKNDATRYGQVWKPFEDMAEASQLDAVATLKGYVQIDQLLAHDFDKGLQAIFDKKGMSPKEWAAKVVGQPADQAGVAQDRVVSELRQEIGNLKQQLGQIGGTVEQQRTQGIDQQLSAFTTSLPETDRTLFNELDKEIAAELQADPGVTLAQAFERAKQNAEARYTKLFGVRAAPTPAGPQTPAPDPAAQTRKGQLSVTGAPGTGSNPDTRQPPSSARQAIDNAFAALSI